MLTAGCPQNRRLAKEASRQLVVSRAVPWNTSPHPSFHPTLHIPFLQLHFAVPSWLLTSSIDELHPILTFASGLGGPAHAWPAAGVHLGPSAGICSKGHGCETTHHVSMSIARLSHSGRSSCNSNVQQHRSQWARREASGPESGVLLIDGRTTVWRRVSADGRLADSPQYWP